MSNIQHQAAAMKAIQKKNVLSMKLDKNQGKLKTLNWRQIYLSLDLLIVALMILDCRVATMSAMQALLLMVVDGKFDQLLQSTQLREIFLSRLIFVGLQYFRDERNLFLTILTCYTQQ